MVCFFAFFCEDFFLVMQFCYLSAFRTKMTFVFCSNTRKNLRRTPKHQEYWNTKETTKYLLW